MEEEYLFVPDYKDISTPIDQNYTTTNTQQKMQHKSGYKQCPLCKTYDSNFKKHVYTHHLPPYLDPQLVCWTYQKYIGSFCNLNTFHWEDHPHNNQFTEECLSHCYSQVNYLLHALSKEITGSDDLQDLTHTIDNNIYPPLDKQCTPFTQFETAFLGGLQQLLGENTQLQITPPNQITSLLHWRILINLFVKLSPQSQKELKTFNLGRPFKDTIQQNHHVIDSHFHLDKML